MFEQNLTSDDESIMSVSSDGTFPSELNIVFSTKMKEFSEETERSDSALSEQKECVSKTISNEIPNAQILHLNGLNPPQTAHIMLQVSVNRFSKKLDIKALHDSGCAKSIISLRMFNKISQKELLSVTPLPNIFISSCTGEKTNVIGITTLTLTFEGENKN